MLSLPTLALVEALRLEVVVPVLRKVLLQVAVLSQLTLALEELQAVVLSRPISQLVEVLRLVALLRLLLAELLLLEPVL